MKSFIPNYSSRMIALTSMLKKNASYKWGSEQQKAYDEVIGLMEEAATLVTPMC